MRMFTTAGERVVVASDVPRFGALLENAAAGELSGVTAGAAEPSGVSANAAGATVRLQVEAGSRPFGTDGWTLVTRGAWAAPPRVLLTDACSSGFDLLVEPRGPTLHVTARYRPAPRTRAANVVLAGRFRLLAAQTLLHYPVLWWASLRGRVPLHVSVTAGAGGVTMLAGPSGVGKSTLLTAGLRRGETATADNICACDTRRAYGLVEPLRVESAESAAIASVPLRPDGQAPAGGLSSASGPVPANGRAPVNGRASSRRPAAPHGRREYPLPGRVACLEPDRLVVLSRAPSGSGTTVRTLPAAQAARALVTGTYMAGELRRFWPFAATLALATGLGPAHPDVAGVAAAVASRLPCAEVRLARGSRVPIGDLLATAGAT